MSDTVPIVLFAYARPNHLRQTLDCLRENHVPLIYAFSDGPRTTDKAPAVAKVREMLRAVDWCEVVLCERETNLGLGRSILTGVTEVLGKHETAIVFEDDLVCVPGTYDYLCAALERYRGESRVMSVTGWTHPKVTPSNLYGQSYFDGRAESLVWGTWKRSWIDIENWTAVELIEKCVARGIRPNSYGADLLVQAKNEIKRNIWAVRWLYLHLYRNGLCMRPPHSLVEHIGWDNMGTNAKFSGGWANPPLAECPSIPEKWPEPIENPECKRLWRKATSWPNVLNRRLRKAVQMIINTR